MDYHLAMIIAQTLLSPLLALFRPRRTGAWIAEAPTVAILLLVMLWGVVLGGIVRACVTYVLEEPVVRYPFAGMQLDPVLVFGSIVPIGLGMVMALIQAPRIIRRRNQALRGVMIAWGCVASAAGAAAIGITLFLHATQMQSDLPGMLVLLGGITCLLILIGTVIRGAAERIAAPDDLPFDRCEACGYDLTHVPEDGRCAECGCAVATSQDDNPRRVTREADWVAGLMSFLKTARRVFFGPMAFYRTLPLRADSAPAERFGRMTMIMIWLANVAASAMSVAYLVVINRWNWWNWDYLLMVFAMSSGIAFGAYAVHRIVAAFWQWLMILANMLPDGRWGAKVMCYETVFTWPILIFSWAIMLSIPLGFDWDRELRWLSRALPFYLPPTFILLAAGCVSLGVLWLWRLGRIFRVIRYSNE